MPIPTYDQFIEPLLRFLGSRPGGATKREAVESAADTLAISPEDRERLLPSGHAPVYRNRIGWAHDRLKRAGLSSSVGRGLWKITQEGLAFLDEHPEPFSREIVERIANNYNHVLLGQPKAVETPEAALLATTPAEQLDATLREIQQSVAADLLEVLAQVAPQHFELIVLDLLHKMGYGSKRSDAQRVGGVGDGGIDGVISLDKLGLEKVYVQAKRWQGSVGRPELQAFYGALAAHRANRGVFITTSTYTTQAREYVQSVERIVLIDGPTLAELMIEYEVGITSRSVKIPQLDRDYFDY